MIDYKLLSDAQLILLLKDSDHSAYTEIYNRYYYLMIVHAYKKLRNEDQSKDIVQELFTALWIKRDITLTTNNLAGYLYTAIRNRILDFFSHQNVESRYILSVKDYSINHSATTDHLIREKEFNAYIEREIQALPPKMREIFKLSRKEHLSYQKIAEKTGTSENNISKQINNAVKILRKKLHLFMSVFIP